MVAADVAALRVVFLAEGFFCVTGTLNLFVIRERVHNWRGSWACHGAASTLTDYRGGTEGVAVLSANTRSIPTTATLR